MQHYYLFHVVDYAPCTRSTVVTVLPTSFRPQVQAHTSDGWRRAPVATRLWAQAVTVRVSMAASVTSPTQTSRAAVSRRPRGTRLPQGSAWRTARASASPPGLLGCARSTSCIQPALQAKTKLDPIKP
eukprot:scaffold439_cov415-Prasinococcus_capsulatus_cf.AAC.42